MKFLRIRDVVAIRPESRSTWLAHVQKGLCPYPTKPVGGIACWRDYQIDQVNAIDEAASVLMEDQFAEWLDLFLERETEAGHSVGLWIENRANYHRRERGWKERSLGRFARVAGIAV